MPADGVIDGEVLVDTVGCTTTEKGNTTEGCCWRVNGYGCRFGYTGGLTCEPFGGLFVSMLGVVRRRSNVDEGCWMNGGVKFAWECWLDNCASPTGGWLSDPDSNIPLGMFFSDRLAVLGWIGNGGGTHGIDTKRGGKGGIITDCCTGMSETVAGC